ncbi:MAG: Fic/DOC family protein [Mycobacteriaceae bacterium]|uniref:Fic/DOC family protein n=1 Tax=Corynebacterium sp. TaxID=1720 RepID=UPI003F9B1CDE
MTDFATLCGLSAYRDLYPDALASLSDAAAHRVVEALHSGVLEGWHPTAGEMAAVAERILAPGASALTAGELSSFVNHFPAAEVDAPGDRAASGPPAWRRYFWPGTSVMRNRLAIRNNRVLAAVEFRVTALAADDLATGTVAVAAAKAGQRLASIHDVLLGHLYDWAGTIRDVNISKADQNFGDFASMGMYLRQLDRRISRLDHGEPGFDERVNRLADIHTHLNFAHPFREGNGRAARIFMAQLAHDHGVELDYVRVNGNDWNGASAANFLDPDGLELDPEPLRGIYRRIAA